MTPEKLNRLWLLVSGILILIIIAAGLFILSQRSRGQALVIIPPPETLYQGRVYIDGAVNNPGVYAYLEQDTLSGLIGACGGFASGADPEALHLHIPSQSVSEEPQKVDINRAPVWLLEALPGIGEIKAQAILDYRAGHGYFDNIEQITEVPGITPAVYVKIKDYITTGR